MITWRNRKVTSSPVYIRSVETEFTQSRIGGGIGPGGSAITPSLHILSTIRENLIPMLVRSTGLVTNFAFGVSRRVGTELFVIASMIPTWFLPAPRFRNAPTTSEARSSVEIAIVHSPAPGQATL